MNPSSSLRAYLVEDSPVIRENLIDTLSELASVQVVGYADREIDALGWLQAHPNDWDVLIIDIFLRQGSGLGVLRSVLPQSANRKIVVFSNYATVDMRTKCRELGADAVFDKSNEIDDLIAYCRRLAADAPA